MVSISGGADSDVMLDLIEKVRLGDNVKYVFFDTGLEYNATKEHLKYLENRYSIAVERRKAKKPIPLCNKEYGQPFGSKIASEYINRLQKHGFKFEDEPFDVLLSRYPKCKAALRWWCDNWNVEDGKPNRSGIGWTPHMKAFLIDNPPTFKISNKCCYFAKKAVAASVQNFYPGLDCTGVRKAEGGARATYGSCFTPHKSKSDTLRPIFWYSDTDKSIYEDHYKIVHSDCYTKYGLKRTGCVGCPYGRNLSQELEILEKYEPKLLKAVNHIFQDSYEYTKKYRAFCHDERENMKEERRRKNETAKRN